MAQAELPPDHITEYERAVCYFTLPRVRSPLTFGLILAYGVCLFEAVVFVVYGVVWENDTFLTWGLYGMAGMIAFGLIVFFFRALLDDIRKRKLLAQARATPDADAEGKDLPDPFKDHLLLRRPAHVSSALYACTEDDATIDYIVEALPEQGLWKLKTPQDEEVCIAKVLKGAGSFLFDQDLPRCIGIYEHGEEVARICRRFSFDAAETTIEPAVEKERLLTVRRKGIYDGDRLVGRLYNLRGSYYLDVERGYLTNPLLAYFVTVS
jgi:hypothetical protein